MAMMIGHWRELVVSALQHKAIVLALLLGVAGGYLGYEVVITLRAQQEAIAKTAELLQEQLLALRPTSEDGQGQLPAVIAQALKLLADDGVSITFAAGDIRLVFGNDASGEETTVIPMQVELPARVEALGPCMVALYQHFQVHQRGEPVVLPPACESFRTSSQ